MGLPPATWLAKPMRSSTSALARGPRWRRTDPSSRTRDGGDDVDDGNDDSGGDGNHNVHGDDDGDEDDGEDDDVDDDGAFADDGDGHDQRRWKDFDVRARAWPAWYYLIRIHAADKFANRARAAREGPFERNVKKNHWLFKVQHVRASRNFR